jgi:hypothetical protein
MRVAIWVVLSSIFLAAASAGAAPVVEASVSYPTAVSVRNAAAGQDAIKASAVQQKRDSAALSSKTSGANFAASARGRANALAFDRRLASLDPSHIVYEQSQSQPLPQAGLLDLSNGRLFPRPEQRPRQQQHARSAGDFLLMGFAALMLIAYQLRKKHRILRPQPFSY